MLKILLQQSLVIASRPHKDTEFEIDTTVKPQHQPWQTVTVFKDCYQGLEHTKNGMLAFVGETPLVQGAIKNEFKPTQICDLRKQSIMNEPMYMILPKNSQYTEMFKVAMLKASEAGLLDRTKQSFSADMPACMAGVTVYSVPLSKVRGAIFVIGSKFLGSFFFQFLSLYFFNVVVGFISSTSCFMLELVWKLSKDLMIQMFKKITKPEKNIDEVLLSNGTNILP